MPRLRRQPQAAEMTGPDPFRDPDVLERIFHAALTAGDAKGVDAALRLLAATDPRRARRLYDGLETALEIVGKLDPSPVARVLRRGTGR